ncbi:MAG TPA: sigma-E factor negative regulatory protein [Hyphomicrobiales bacterium]|nr:sigma-E factor negative regulatory protein [Hyphomicrobiales bacterium]
MTDKKNEMDTGNAVNGQHSASQADLESLSALMDHEAGELEIRRLVRKLPEHPELLHTWQRYQLARAVLHADAHVRPTVNLLGGIHAELEQDSVPTREQHRFGRLLRVAGQGAIAASVAAFVLVGVGSLQQAKQDAGMGESAAIAAAQLDDQVPELAGEYHPSGLERTVRLDSAARTRLQQAVYQFSSSPMSSSDGTLIFELPQTQELSVPPQAAPPQAPLP